MRRLRIVLFVFVVVTLVGASPQPTPLPPMTGDKWRADVDSFAQQIPRRHANAFHAMSRSQFDQAIGELKAKTGTATDDEMIVGLMAIAAQIGDGHTRVQPPAGIHRLPLSIVQFGDEFRITHAAPDARAALGGTLVRIGDTPIAEVVSRLRRVISQDESEWFVRGVLPGMMAVTEVLHGLQIVPDPMRVRVTVRNDSGTEIPVDVTALPANASPLQWPSAQTKTPAVRLDPQAALAFTYLDPARTVVVSFRRYADLRERSRELWKFVDSNAVEKIVIDLRNNGGGDYTVGRKYLVSELQKRPKIKPYVLIGNRTFSAAMNNAIDFRKDAHATLVGQPIGEKANSYQESDELILPNSKLVVSYSTRYYKFLPDDASPIVTPDHAVAATWADFVAGRDPALEWALAQK